MSSVFALVDCNNFYASCEKLFRPDIKHRAVVVLSNNDGCVVARSKEAKALGIKMGVPAFQIKDMIHKHAIVVFSSNYALYADMSNRVMQTLEALSPRVEVYSIDEAFVDLTSVDRVMPLADFGYQVKDTVAQYTGMAVCVGIAPSKTLAKLANYAAKKYSATHGVLDLTDKTRQRKLMAITPVNEVWGVGGKLTTRLAALGITTALHLADANAKQLRKHFSVVMEKTISELNGESCLELEMEAPAKQQILCSRSFGEVVTDKHIMQQLVSGYIARAAEKLRYERQCCGHVQVFIRTSFFRQGAVQYGNAASTRFPVKTDDTRVLTRAALSLLDMIWKDGVRYAKAGVMLTELGDQGVVQQDLFNATNLEGSKKLMALLDRINTSTHGKAWFASQGQQSPWTMKREHLSPAYTTQWLALPLVR